MAESKSIKARLLESFRRADEDGDQGRMEGIAIAARICGYDLDGSPKQGRKADGSVELTESTQAEYDRFCELAGVEGYA